MHIYKATCANAQTHTQARLLRVQLSGSTAPATPAATSKREATALWIAALLAPPNTILLSNNNALVLAATRGHGRSLLWKTAATLVNALCQKRPLGPMDLYPYEPRQRALTTQTHSVPKLSNEGALVGGASVAGYRPFHPPPHWRCHLGIT